MKYIIKTLVWLNNRLIIRVLLGLLLVSCQHKTVHEEAVRDQYIYKNAESLIEVSDTAEVIDVTKAIPLSIREFIENLVDSVYFLQLSSKELIGEVWKLHFFEDKIYILDRFVAKKVFIFNFKGELLRVIDSQGGGPEEYLLLGEIAIEESKKELLVSDGGSTKYLHYSLDGEFLYVTKGITKSYYYPGSDGIYYNSLGYGQMRSESNDCHELLVSKDTSIIRIGFPFFPLQQNAAIGNPFYKNTLGELLYTSCLCDTVYQLLSDSSYRAKYVVEQAKSLWKHKDEYLTNSQQTDLVFNQAYTSFDHSFLENEDFCVVPICKKYKRGVLISPYYYNKENRSVHYLDLEKGFDSSTPFKKGFFNIVNPKCTYKGYFVGAFNPAPVKEGKELLNPSYREILEKADENTNPVLIFYKLNPKYK
ncbi:6-bladed beta-propeller [Parabacteroides pacaensis]|uniref:6-bladed beta-propeller n=1 Tax=Parabacteroides pacaensis TaxID=2086575 RepID=UPI000D10491A|nr:6-bladed beta-propeller [Parabacteroides pacaensis]